MAAPPATSLPLSGRTAIITGASRGMGREIAVHLASLGANIVINYASSSTKADLLATQISSSYPSTLAIAVKADVSNSTNVKSLFDKAEETFSKPAHILIACAGIISATYPTISATSDEDWDSTFSVNAKGAFLCCREAANRLARGGGGRIVVLSSSSVGTSTPGFGAYTASKAAVEAMVRILAKEMKGTAVTANCVAPGPVATELFFDGMTEEGARLAAEASPMGRIGETTDIAPVVGFLCTDAAEWVNGQVIRVNGGSV